MLREEEYFIDSPHPRLINYPYNTGTLDFEESTKTWTFETTGASSHSYAYIDIGEFNVGDRVVVEADVTNVSGANGAIGLQKISKSGVLEGAYAWSFVTNGNGTKKIFFEVVDEVRLMVYFGMQPARIGKTKFKNIKIRKITDVANITLDTGGIDKLVASVRKSTSGVWELIPNRGSNSCTVTPFDATYLKIEFTEKLNKNNSIAFIGMDYSAPNHIVRTGAATGNSVLVQFRKTADGAIEPIASVPNNTYFNVMLV